MPEIANPLEPPPRSITDPVLLRWLEKLHRRLSERGALLWRQTDKAGSSLAELTERPWAAVEKAGSSLSDLEARPWEAVEDTPTTLAGYGVTDAITAGVGLTGGGVLADGVTIDLAPAALAEIGGVLQAPALADVAPPTIAVSSPDATAAPAAYDQTQAASVVTLANETKADLGALVTAHNALLTAHNDLLARLRAAGVLEA